MGIVGAGPAGLLLSHLLARQGIASVVLEARSRAYVEQRIRAGVLEDGTRQILERVGVAERLRREGLRHGGIAIALNGALHRVDFPALTGGHTITVYGQQEVVKDLIAARLASGGTVAFEAEAVSLQEVDSPRPAIVYRAGGEVRRLACDFVAGCDGFHGICREAVPAGALTVFARDYPLAWLGILARTRPAHQELIYSPSPEGFALFSMRSPTLARNYLQVAPDDRLENWPDERIWRELQRRVGRAATVEPGPILERGITQMRSFVVEPMQYGRLFLAGDAAHIVPATGAKGLNLAVADVVVLARALGRYYRDGSADLLATYSETCLRHVWQGEHFAWWMTVLMHTVDDPFATRLRQAQLHQVTSHPTLSRYLAEHYVGMHTSGLYVEWVP
ncbi:MAG: 4-hydroxybenzoate 3-monooxygenase [Armatimonadota bacterium]|nr:4-hydroxybenzoate 3-monooxygenase [Armatimonadota bacterium]